MGISPEEETTIEAAVPLEAAGATPNGMGDQHFETGVEEDFGTTLEMTGSVAEAFNKDRGTRIE